MCITEDDIEGLEADIHLLEGRIEELEDAVSELQARLDKRVLVVQCEDRYEPLIKHFQD